MTISKSILVLSALLLSQSAHAFGRPDNPDDGFAAIDMNKDGVLSKAEFMEHGPNPPFISTQKIFKQIDINEDEQITKQEYVDAWYKKRGRS